jgi:hypothetical protein
MTTPIVIGLSAVVAAMRDGELLALTVRPEDVRTHRASALQGLPSGPFDPEAQRTFELALRAFVTAQTGFELGYVEQLYTFGDKGRGAPLPDLGASEPPQGARVISVGYLALAPEAAPETAHGAASEPGGAAADARWSPWSRFFPWEDWRGGRPDVLDTVIAPHLEAWAKGRVERLSRARSLFAVGGSPWNEERVLDRYELLYEAGLAAEAARDRGRTSGLDSPEPSAFPPAFGQPMVSDHRRILATGLGRLRGKLKYRPVVFELMPETFTLYDLQRAVEAISGVRLHKQNFRRMVERTGLVEGLGRFRAETGGRPAELFRYKRESAGSPSAVGFSLPGLRDG